MGVPGPSVPVDSALTSGRKGHSVQADESRERRGLGYLFWCSRDVHPRPRLSLIGRDPEWQVVPVAGVLVAGDWEQRQGDVARARHVALVCASCPSWRAFGPHQGLGRVPMEVTQAVRAEGLVVGTGTPSVGLGDAQRGACCLRAQSEDLALGPAF